MNSRLKAVLDTIASENADHIQDESRYYREVNIGRQAERAALDQELRMAATGPSAAEVKMSLSPGK